MAKECDGFFRRTGGVTMSNLPPHRFGVHLIQNRQDDLEYIRALRPPAIKIVDPDPAVLRWCLDSIDKNGIVMLRDHPLSEQKDDMNRDPEGTGIRHADDWNQKLKFGRFKEFASFLSKIVVIGINEPNVHNEAEEKIVVRYTSAFLSRLTSHGIHGGALNLSVGWPRNEGQGKPPIWDSFRPLEKIILNGNHFWVLHEYWHPKPENGWGWYGNRVGQMPLNGPVIIGECGYTRQLIRMDIEQPWGWRGNLSIDEYARQLWWYHDNVDPNVFAIMPFTTGFAGAEWESKDTQPAHSRIVQLAHSYPWPKVWPVPRKTVDIPPDNPTTSKKFNLVWPAITRVTQYYGGKHSGLDLGMIEGTPIYALWDGIVAWVDTDSAPNGGYGKYVRIYYPELGFDSLFAHLSRQDVSRGDRVSRGQRIGLSGNTGNSTGPHLHLEIRMKEDGLQSDRRGVGPFTRGQVDPLAVLWALHNLYGHEER